MPFPASVMKKLPASELRPGTLIIGTDRMNFTPALVISVERFRSDSLVYFRYIQGGKTHQAMVPGITDCITYVYSALAGDKWPVK